MTILTVLLAVLLLAACDIVVDVESPGCSASASAGGGGGGGGGDAAHGGVGASGGGSESSAGCTPGKTSVAEQVGSGWLPTQ